jgi:ankyrin repeat protein
VDVLRILVTDNGANLDQPELVIGAWSFAYAAAKAGSTECLQYLADKGCPLNRVTADGDNPAFAAASMGHISALVLLHERGCDLDLRLNVSGWTAMHVAAHSGNDADDDYARAGSIACLTYLLEKVGGIDTGDATGVTPIMIACHIGHLEAVRLLVSYAACLVSPRRRCAPSTTHVAHPAHVLRLETAPTSPS